MHTTIGWWLMSLLQSFDFIKAKVEMHLSFSTLFTICTMASSANFTYLKRLETSIWYVVTKIHMWVKRLVSKGGTIQDVVFDFIVSLNMPCWVVRIISI